MAPDNEQLIERINEQLENLSAGLETYLGILKRLFVNKFNKAHHCRRYFFRLLLSLSEIYLTCLKLYELLQRLPSQRLSLEELDSWHQFRQPARRKSLEAESRMREEIAVRIKELPFWKFFRAEEDFFAESTRLFCKQDYIDNLCTHLPEIYGEALHMQWVLGQIMSPRITASSLAPHHGWMMVWIEHVAHNHISHVHFTLENLTEDVFYVDYDPKPFWQWDLQRYEQALLEDAELTDEDKYLFHLASGCPDRLLEDPELTDKDRNWMQERMRFLKNILEERTEMPAGLEGFKR